jgi:hypothetical protein
MCRAKLLTPWKPKGRKEEESVPQSSLKACSQRPKDFYKVYRKLPIIPPWELSL